MKETKPVVHRTINATFAQVLQEDLIATGKTIGLTDRLGQAAGGKTGTAQTSGGSTNAWTIGFAPAANPRVLVCVVVEDDGRSGQAAAMPIVAKILELALQK